MKTDGSFHERINGEQELQDAVFCCGNPNDFRSFADAVRDVFTGDDHSDVSGCDAKSVSCCLSRQIMREDAGEGGTVHSSPVQNSPLAINTYPERCASDQASATARGG